MATVIVRGSGDVGSAVAHMLFSTGFRVVIHDQAQPAHTRRRMAFTDAIFARTAELEHIIGKRATAPADVPRMFECGRAVPVSVSEFQALADAVQPDVIVDARMRKRDQPEEQRGAARLTIGLGPNFRAGVTTDLVIETAWGPSLGTVIESGDSLPLVGEPRPIGGAARERYVYAPGAGMFTTSLDIGATVRAGEEVARIDAIVIRAPLTGRLRGITHTDVPVRAGTKIVEVDPRMDAAQVSGISRRPAAIAKGVLRALQAHCGG